MKSTEAWYEELFTEYGPYVPIRRAWRQLSLPSLDAARKAVAKGTLPIQSINMEGRRGSYVRTIDLANWIGRGVDSPPLQRR